MKKLLLIPIVILLGLFIASCEDSTTNPPAVTTGTLAVVSTPAGAQIWVDGSNTGKVTPDSVQNLSSSQTHSLTLKLDGYKDSIQSSISITAGQTTTRNITLTRAATNFGPVRLWETTGTTAAQPSGLDLSTGTAYGISGADNAKVDVYYSSTGFVVRSASAATGLTRITSFFVGSGTNLNDGMDSPLATGTWASSMGDREPNYVFLFDNDQHYSKLKITGFGGGTPGNPAWVEVHLIYNEQANSKVF